MADYVFTFERVLERLSRELDRHDHLSKCVEVELSSQYYSIGFVRPSAY